MLRDIGVTYRLHAAELPGSPDIVVRKHRKAIFVHGCFWHQHEGCTLAKRTSARPDYWLSGGRRFAVIGLRTTQANSEFGGTCQPAGPAAEVADTAMGKAVSRGQT